MSIVQRRIGPFNLGGYGFLSSIMNGLNLVISQFLIPKLHLHLQFQSFPILFMNLSLVNNMILYPFFILDIYYSLMILIVFSGLSIVFSVVAGFSGCSKYSMLGSIRILSQ